MNGHGKSDSSVVPVKVPNKVKATTAEVPEGRGLAKENSRERNGFRTQCRDDPHSALRRVREVAKRKKGERFTTLLHHVYDIDRLTRAYNAIKRDAAAGIDGETWEHYGENLEQNIRALSNKLKQNAYRAKPVRRTYIPKADGRLRPLGVPALEDKIVQRAVVEVLNAIYEQDFLGFSYGFRPRRSQHMALDALAVGITKKNVCWVLDADIKSFFDTLDHGWLKKFIEHRIADKRVLRLIQKWLSAGVLEEGKRITSETGTVQGGSISPLLANLYLHYVLDLWAQQWRKKRERSVMIVRYADDFVVGFQRRVDAELFQHELRMRFARFGLQLHPEKTRLIEFGRYAAANRKAEGKGKPETFNFLGFTHICWAHSKGYFVVLRQTMRKRRQVKLTELKQELKKRRHAAIPIQAAYLRAVLVGHYRYYGVHFNLRALKAFRYAAERLWWEALRRRGDRRRITWAKVNQYCKRWLPKPRIYHPYPSERFA